MYDWDGLHMKVTYVSQNTLPGKGKILRTIFSSSHFMLEGQRITGLKKERYSVQFFYSLKEGHPKAAYSRFFFSIKFV
jgi:hypothetical protein